MPCHHVAEVGERFLVASRVPMAFRLEAGCSAVAVLGRALGGDRWNRRFQNAGDRSHEGGAPKEKGLARSSQALELSGARSWTRTNDPLINSQVLTLGISSG